MKTAESPKAAPDFDDDIPSEYFPDHEWSWPGSLGSQQGRRENGEAGSSARDIRRRRRSSVDKKS